MLNEQEAIKEYNRQAKKRQTDFEKILIKFHAWEQYPGESFHDFKRRFWSLKILIDIQSLSEEERNNILKKINEQYPNKEQIQIT